MQADATLLASDDLSSSVWNRICQTCLQSDPDARVLGRTLTLSWPAALSALMEIAALRSALGFSIRPEGEATVRLKQFKAEREVVNAAKHGRHELLSTAQVEQKLVALGFNRRVLLPFQLHYIQHMLAVRNGANFSVPGAGKTTVAFAVHLLANDPSHRLLVVSPKNAFEAWDQVVIDCMDPNSLNDGAEAFIRLDGTPDELQRLLASTHRRFLISYDRLIRTQDLVAAYLRRYPTHVVLDESHRIKAGELSRRGRTLLALATLPVR
jgi:hypothetical protein